MDLRRRTLLVVALSFAGIAVALFFTLRSTVLSELSSYELSDAVEQSKIQHEYYLLHLKTIREDAAKLAGKWALSDFMSSRKVSSLSSALPASELQKQGYKLALLLDSSGRPVAG